MKKDYISLLIGKFFANEVSPEIRKKFQSWFLAGDSCSEKEQEMEKLWNEMHQEADERTYRELKALHKRMDRKSGVAHIRILPYLRRIAAVLLLPLVGAIGTYYYLYQEAILPEAEMLEYYVPYGEKKQIILSDGSEVWVNAGSLLVYEKNFRGSTRSLFLSGEANFKVAKDPGKPFIVKTKYMNIEAVGTVFNVQSYPGSPHTTATLEEGKIKVGTNDAEHESFFLHPNEQVVYNHLSKKATLQLIDAAKNARWKQGYLIFQHADFSEIVQSIERRFNISINYETGRYEGRAFTIKFAPDEELVQILDILQRMVGFKYKIEKNVVFIYK